MEYTTEAKSWSTGKTSMQRSVSQLLFSYLPGKTVDWEDGLAIVQLGSVRLSSAWEEKDAEIVLREIEEYISRWKRAGGVIDSSFPQPVTAERCTIGEPKSISATFLEAALICMSCNRLVFLKKRDLATKKKGMFPFLCPDCHQPALRQFPQIFVHGCGNLVTLAQWMPTLSPPKDGIHTKGWYSLTCQTCGTTSVAEIPSKSERVRDLQVRCRTCKTIVRERIGVRCHSCFMNPPTVPPPAVDLQSGKSTKEPTEVEQILMRATSYRASEAYYPHTLTILRLDRPQSGGIGDEEVTLLRELNPGSIVQENPRSLSDAMGILLIRLKEAEQKKRSDQVDEWTKQIAELALGTTPVAQVLSPGRVLKTPSRSLLKNIEESLALKTTVRLTSYQNVLEQDRMAATSALILPIQQAHERLGLLPTLLVDDLPVITTTFGYTRRAFTPVYEENGALLPTQLCPFYPLDHSAAAAVRRPGVVGTKPILAREAEHEGIFLRLDPERVIAWLERNGIVLSNEEQPPLVRILQRLENMDDDRYYDHIWKQSIMRMVFGLLHSLSHAAMRVVSRFAGLERTSLSEYLFLPLLGTVIYANSSTFKMGCMETMIQSNFCEFLDALTETAMSCLIDPDCLDHQGACAGCLHSPEISCRVFNHGLSRAFLIGGHVPWLDASIDEHIPAYWQMNP